MARKTPHLGSHRRSGLRAFVQASALSAGLLTSAASAQSSEAYVEQVGAQNEAAVTQVASAAFLVQAGLGNRAAIEQAGAGGHLVRLEQSGGSLADVLQTGAGNRLVGLAGPESAAVQLGASRFDLVQHGVGNAVALEQAAGAYARVTQVGTGNTATILQH